MDEYIQSQLVLSALNIATNILKEGGNFVAKIFRGKDVSLLYSQLRIFFQHVSVSKPKSSRNASIESFVVCHSFKIPENYTPTMTQPILLQNYDQDHQLTGLNRFIAPFLACGNLSPFDSDANYSLNANLGEKTPNQSIQSNQINSNIPQEKDEKSKEKPDELYKFKPPVQNPISPPYSKAIQKRTKKKK
eukprot:Anaeramoba_ignava/c18745_g1_i1.p1 GENE.c18745_g1_i1~~c18745_g1_i1.p1  ORF type:complete len:190 (+),score=62.52 c18745_g1_i1:504-1073(+)